MRSALLASLRASLDRLGVDAGRPLPDPRTDQPARSHAALAEALAAAHEAGLVKAVGVSNYSAKETRSIDAELRKRGLRLATNQIEFSLLRRVPETGGLLATCAELGVVPLAYSPIGQGRLTGKYSAANPPPGKRGFSAHPMEQVDRVVAELRRIGDAARRHAPRARWPSTGSSPRARCPSRAPRTATQADGERRRARLVAVGRRPRRPRRRRPRGHPQPGQPLLAARLTHAHHPPRSRRRHGAAPDRDLGSRPVCLTLDQMGGS